MAKARAGKKAAADRKPTGPGTAPAAGKKARAAGKGSAARSAGGQGRLAEVLATRGGQAAPEAPFTIEHREALIYMLCEGAELEHGIMCQYLFAAFSLKQREDEGLTADELEAVTRWRRVIAHVATEEMLHLALVHNLLSAIGAAPHLARPNLPAPAHHYPAGVNLTLVPFGEAALQHFLRRVGLLVPYADGGSLAELHELAGEVTRQDTPEGVRVRAILPARLAARFARFAVASPSL